MSTQVTASTPLTLVLAVLAVLGPATAPAASLTAEQTETTLRLSTESGVAVIDLSVPGGAPVTLRPTGGADVLGDTDRGLGITIEGQGLPEGPWRLSEVDEQQPGPGAATVRWTLGRAPAPLLVLERTFTLRSDVAGLAIETRLEPLAPAYVTDYRLADLALDPDTLEAADLTAHDYHGGADWRDVFAIEKDATAPADHRAQLLEARTGDGGNLVASLIRRGANASRIATHAGPDGTVHAAFNVNLSREIITTGPIEPHQVNLGQMPGDVGVRGLPLTPGEPVTLEPVLLATGHDRLEALWGHHRLITQEGPGTFAPRVTYNTNVWDGSPHPTADTEERLFLRYYQTAGSTPYMIMNRSIFQREVPMADRAGVETFVIDDGWQYLSGDWTPHPAKFPGGLGPERRLLEEHGIELGLWMSPLEFNGRSRTAHQNPDWICHPTGTAMMAYPDQAGFAVWNVGHAPFADHLVDEMGRLHTAYGASYLKFDFMTWVDCAGTTPTTIHEYALAFRDVLREAQERYPGLTLQLDETNDNRLAVLGSIWQGPNWFHNGDPSMARTLRILGSLAPHVPLHYVGMPTLNGEVLDQPGALLGPASLWGHPTIWSRLSEMPDDVLDTAGDWLRIYRAHRPLFAGLTLPLDAPEGTFALERVRPDQGRAFVAAMDPRGHLAEATTLTVTVQLPCEGEIARFDPLGRSEPTVLGPRTDAFEVELTLEDRAATAMLVCLDATPSLAYAPHQRAADTILHEDAAAFDLAGPQNATRSVAWLDPAGHQATEVLADGVQIPFDPVGELIRVDVPQGTSRITMRFAS